MVKKDENKKDKSKVKIDKLQVNRETVHDLTDEEIGKIRGGAEQSLYGACTANLCPTEYAGCTQRVRVDCLGQPGPKDPPPQSGWCGSNDGCK